MRVLKDIPSSEVKEAALRAVREENGRIEASWAASAVARLLGGDLYDEASLGVQPGWYRQIMTAQQRWAGRVRGAMNALAADGTLVKVSRGSRTPGGALTRNTAYYYTPEAFKAEAEQARQKAAEALSREERWGAVRQRLWNGTGLALLPQGAMTLDNWEKLLEKGGW